MKCFLKAAACLTLLLAASAGHTQALDLVNPAYIYVHQDSKVANFMYIGFAPRMEDNKRIRVIISKAGYTMRVAMNMTPQDVIDYPRYLLRRFDQVNEIVATNGLEIYQKDRYDYYTATIEDIRDNMSRVRPDMQSQYEYGLALLKFFFPQNIFEIVENGNVARVEAHFVYPITIHVSESWPKPMIYRAYDINERRSHFRPKNNEIFGGFPAIWLDPAGKGTGVHGPIRYSRSSEDNPNTQEKGNTMKDFWATQNFLNEPINPVKDLDPRIRWDLVRMRDSHGCFRSESMELRHLLPSDPNAIMDNNKRKLNLDVEGPGVASREIDYDSVEFDVRQGYDVLTIPGYFENRIVNVDYYVTNPYKAADKSSWLKSYMLTSKERNTQDWETTLMSKMESEIQTFPYLNPQTLEFKTKSGGAANSIMTLLNQAH